MRCVFRVLFGFSAYLIAGMMLLSGAAFASTSYDLSGPVTVTKVSDGDSLRSGKLRIRIFGIDAPELGQPYGRESRESLAELVFGKQIAVLAISRDTAGPAICQVSVDGRDVSAALVAAGAAWADPATGTSLTPEQQQAQQGRKGLWAEDNPQPPWEFRETGNAPWQPSA